MNARLRLENRHTGEWLQLRRVRDRQQEILEIEGGVPPHAEGPPAHVHLGQTEEGVVVSGRLSAQVGARTASFGPGEAPAFARGVAHRWWNDGEVPLVFRGRAIPAADLDRFLQAAFAVVNASAAGRPSLFHIAHVLHRHRRTQRLAALPGWVMSLVLPIVIAVGRLAGAYPRSGWPGSPGSCAGAPVVDASESMPQPQVRRA